MIYLLRKLPLWLGWFLLGASSCLWLWIIWRIILPGPPKEAENWGVGDWVGYNVPTMGWGHLIFVVGGILSGTVLGLRAKQISPKWSIGLAITGFLLTLIGIAPFNKCVFWWF